MTANIYSAAFAITPAWHNLGTTLDHVMTWQEAVKEAGLNWSVEEKKLYYRNGNVHEVKDYKLLVRSSDGAELGMVGKGYQPIQNEYAFAFVDVLLQAENGAHYESAGALGNGERVWCLARVPHTITIAGTDDKTECFLLFSTSHDGSMSASAKLTTVRVVCQNTLNAALKGAGAMLRVKHTASAMTRMETAKKLMSGVGVDVKELERKLNILARREMTKENMLDALNRIFPPSKAETEDASTTNTRRENLVASVLGNYEDNDKNAFPEIKGTAYNLLQAVTRYVDHDRSARLTEDRIEAGYTAEKARAENALFGSGDQLKQLAFVSIMSATEKAKVRDVSRVFASASVPPTSQPSQPSMRATETKQIEASDDMLRDAIASFPASLSSNSVNVEAEEVKEFVLFDSSYAGIAWPGKEIERRDMTKSDAVKLNQSMAKELVWMPAGFGPVQNMN